MPDAASGIPWTIYVAIVCHGQSASPCHNGGNRRAAKSPRGCKMRNLRITSPFSIAIVATVVFGLSFMWGSPFSLPGSRGAEAAGNAAD